MTSRFRQIKRRSMTKPGVGTIEFFSGPLRRSRLTQVTYTPEAATTSYVVPRCAHEAIIAASTASAALYLLGAHRRPDHDCDLTDERL